MAAYESVVVSHLLFGGLLWFGLIAWGLAATGGLLSRPAAQMTSANPKIGSLI